MFDLFFSSTFSTFSTFLIFIYILIFSDHHFFGAPDSVVSISERWGFSSCVHILNLSFFRINFEDRSKEFFDVSPGDRRIIVTESTWTAPRDLSCVPDLTTRAWMSADIETDKYIFLG